VLAVVAVLGLLVTVAALRLWPAEQGAEPTASSRQSSGSPAPEAATRLDVSNLPIGRTLDCGALDDEAVVTALGAPVTDREAYATGDRVEVAPGVTDVVHEDGCVFSSGDVEAAVWVFTAPVGTPHARSLVREARREERCTFPQDTTRFGRPGLAGVCRVRTPDRAPAVAATYRGLFGSTWLSCRLTAPGGSRPEIVQRHADRWCVHVATTLGARP
jgi:hypothetical protein